MLAKNLEEAHQSRVLFFLLNFFSTKSVFLLEADPRNKEAI